MSVQLPKKALTKIVFVLVVIFLITTGISAYFFNTVDPPILDGEVLYGIEYKEGLTLDIYQPTNPVYQEVPVVVFIHGGAWIVGRKESINMNRFNGAIGQLRSKGYAIVSLEYTLATNGSPFPDCIVDAYDALKWIENNASTYQFDLTNTGLFGESAGAHIAMMTAYSNPESFAYHDSVIPIQYVVDVYGPVDLDLLRKSQMLDSAKSILSQLPNHFKDHLNFEKRLFGFDPNVDTSKALLFTKKYSPIHQVKSSTPPTLIVHGTDDILVPFDQSQELLKVLKSNNVEAELHSLERVNHAFIGASQEQKENVQKWITDFITTNYRKK